MQNAPAFRLQSTKTERQVRVCEFQNRTLFLHLPAEFIQRLDMPEAFGFLRGLILSIVMVVQVFFSSFGKILTDTAWRGGVICGKNCSSYRTSHLPCSAEAKTASTACWFFRPSSTVAAKPSPFFKRMSAKLCIWSLRHRSGIGNLENTRPSA